MHIETININVSSGQPSTARAFIEALLRTPEVDDPADPPTPTDTRAAGTSVEPPRIGEPWPKYGGTYAGLSRGEDGEPDGHIVLLDARPEKNLKFDDAWKWAEALSDGARLPRRFEAALLYANLRDKIDTTGWYWTGTQSSAGSAWVQYFYLGLQHFRSKDFEGRAVAVRRLVL